MNLSEPRSLHLFLPSESLPPGRQEPRSRLPSRDGCVTILITTGAIIGAGIALGTAVAAAYFFAESNTQNDGSECKVRVPFREGLQAAVFFGGQVVINNCDIIVVKHLFSPESAGVYAAVAMVGRVVFAFSWAVVSSMFPVAAEARSRRQQDSGVLATALLLVTGICLLFMAGLRVAPGTLWTHLFGPQFGTVGGDHFRYLLMLYAFCASVYALSVVVIAYEMSRKIANTGWVQLLVGGAVVLGIYIFHSSLAQVIWVQVVMMAVLLVCAAVPVLISSLMGDVSNEPESTFSSIALGRLVSEDEVIAEFLKNHLHCSQFRRYREVMNGILTSPDLEDRGQNQVRRSLFAIRHEALWWELPDDTEWFEADLQLSDLQRIRVFPRAQWRKLALGDFGITRIASRIFDERYRDRTAKAFVAKVADIRRQLQEEGPNGTILLIGSGVHGPFTILDGNHRLVAALLAFPESVARFRVFCGISPRMVRCCWYETNLLTLLRYGSNKVRHFVRRPEQELIRLLRSAQLLQTSDAAEAQS